MSIFGKIMDKIRGRAAAAPAARPAPAAPAARPAAPAAPMPPPAPAPAPAAPAPMAAVDVEAVLEELASTYDHKVNWRHSIVDLMAILGIDNSLAERKALARELGYTGDMNDSAPMNIWLHKQVLRKLAENGGRVPAELLD